MGLLSRHWSRIAITLIPYFSRSPDSRSARPIISGGTGSFAICSLAGSSK